MTAGRRLLSSGSVIVECLVGDNVYVDGTHPINIHMNPGTQGFHGDCFKVDEFKDKALYGL